MDTEVHATVRVWNKSADASDKFAVVNLSFVSCLFKLIYFHGSRRAWFGNTQKISCLEETLRATS